MIISIINWAVFLNFRDFSRVTLPDEFSNPLQDHNPSQDHSSLQDPLSSPGIHSLLYTDAKRQLHDINLDVGQKWTGHGAACPSEVDFSNVVRPNFDAISVTSSGLDPSFLYHNLYGELALPTSAFASQVYADGFPELYYQPNYMSRKRSSDGQLLSSEGDDYICPSIDSPLKRFKSSEVYPAICMTAGFSSNLVDDFNEFPEDTSAHRVGCYSSCSKQAPRMDPPKDSNDTLVGAHADTLTMTDTGLYSYGNAIQNTTKMLAQWPTFNLLCNRTSVEIVIYTSAQAFTIRCKRVGQDVQTVVWGFVLFHYRWTVVVYHMFAYCTYDMTNFAGISVSTRI